MMGARSGAIGVHDLGHLVTSKGQLVAPVITLVGAIDDPKVGLWAVGSVAELGSGQGGRVR